VKLETATFTGDILGRRSLRRLLGRPSAHLAVAEDDGPVGYALTLFRAGSATARLYSLAVRRDRHGRGIGRALVADAIRTARKRACRRIVLEVRGDNVPARRLYHGLGFRFERTVPDYYEDGTAGERWEMSLEDAP
jgi:ribosomal-protein-alanine N-acetyltransferase